MVTGRLPARILANRGSVRSRLRATVIIHYQSRRIHLGRWPLIILNRLAGRDVTPPRFVSALSMSALCQQVVGPRHGLFVHFLGAKRTLTNSCQPLALLLLS